MNQIFILLHLQKIHLMLRMNHNAEDDNDHIKEEMNVDTMDGDDKLRSRGSMDANVNGVSFRKYFGSAHSSNKAEKCGESN